MDADSLYDNLDSRPQSINGATNQWEMPGGWKPDAGSIYSERRRNEAAGQDSLRTRLEAVNTAEGTDYQKEERYGRRSFDSDEDPAWSSGFFNRALPSEKTMTQRLSAWSYNLLHPGLPGLQQRLQDKIMPSYAAMKAINEQSKELNEQFSREYSSERLSSASGDQPHGSLLSPDAEYISERNAARARMSDETVSAPRTILPAETTTVSQNPGVFARQEPPASPRGQVQSRPAILPFPKKPGSVFQ
jgi:hypothetical protein